ncbi:unnamed protein product [Vitrella brassicaformis CCMP3155]|uniref:J domain-containing protein n=2 Tax=Vitrella brassicaformis TaxID=1169539 RepID=A0A0G4G1E8_VITBC|nr:unnamed protein product [Vitrella brassicaformis CCMP3155]|eukprot:CEM21669.1 unnamed protein product [Vitrella brassicaformis CCMP3155]
MGDTDINDDIMAAFLSEIESLPKEGDKKKPDASAAAKAPSYESPQKEVIRLTAKIFTNSFEIFKLTPDATEEDLKKAYRKLSLIIHPDKCKHERAHDAFQVVSKAYEELQMPENRAKYKGVIDDARRELEKVRAKENKRRKAAGDPPLEESTFDEELAALCEKKLKTFEARRAYAEKTRKANEMREKQQEDELEKEEEEKRKEKRKWEEMRDQRVDSWRQFQTDVKDKRVKVEGVKAVGHKKEQRTGRDVDPHARKLPMGIDESYKDKWR